MAENSLSLSNLEGVQSSISQENTQVTNDLSLSKLEGVKDITINDTNELSLSNLEGIDIKDSPKKSTDYVGISPEFTTGIAVSGEPSTAEKIAYGIDKQNMFFGNVFRVAKSGIQAAFDPDKDFKEVALQNAAKERAELFKRHEKFRDGKYDDDIEVLAAEMATFLVDPYYIFMYMTPWGRAMSMRQSGLKAAAKVAGVSAGAVSLDTLFDNLATTGEANPQSVAEAGALAGVLGPASMKAFQIIGKLFPKADKQKIAQVVGVIQGKTKKQLGVTDKEFRALQKIAGDKEFLKLNRQVSTVENTAKKLVQEAAENEGKYLKSVLDLDAKIAILKADKKLVQSDVVGLINKTKAKKSISDKIANLKRLEKKRQKEFDTAQAKLWKKQSEISKKVIDETTKRNTQFLEKLWKEKSLTEKTVKVVLASSIRPLMGASVAYGFGKLWGPDDANLSNWMLVGATLGGIQKGIQASKILPGQSKNLIQRMLYQDATKYTFQKVRELTSTTTSSKLASIGGDTEAIGLQLLEGIDSPFARSTVTQRADNLLREWQLRIANIVKPYSLDEQSKAISKIRGSKAKTTSRVNTLAKNIEQELQDFKALREKAGIFSLNEKTGRLVDIKNYFPRVYNWAKIKENPEQFEKVLVDIFKSLGYKPKDAIDQAKLFSNSLIENTGESVVNKTAVNDIINSIGSKKFKAPTGVLKNNPLSDHITKNRVLEGPYAKVEKILEQNGYLVDNVFDVFSNLYNRSMKSIAFAEKFGSQGQLLKPYLQSITKKYEDLAGKTLGITKENYKEKAAKEIALVMNTIDGFFDRYGTKIVGTNKSIAGTLATIANLNMLDRVTIASLGDIVQPFANSNNFTSFFRGAIRTGFTSGRETGLAKNLNLNLGNEIRNWLLKQGSPAKKRSNAQAVLGQEAVLRFDDGTKAANVMGEMGTIAKVNEFGFKVMGLSWLTGLARRYAYNVGAVDAYLSSNKLAKFVNAGNRLNSSKGLRLTRDINKYGLDVEDALKIGRFNSFDEAAANKGARKILNSTGILAANRDALIPQVQNRLLFAQSRNPWVRLMGQFTSWAMAKSTQTNKLLTRIEDGEAKQMVKLLASLPVYGGIQMLRELAKNGEVMTDPAHNEGKWWAEALRLSGMSGILPELFIGRLTGPGSAQPWFIPFPAASVATDVGKIAQDTLSGDTDKAVSRFWEKVMPFPTYRKWIMDLFNTGTKSTRFNDGLDLEDNTILQQKFNIGGVVSKILTKAAAKSATNINRAKTAISTTEGTYSKANKILTDLNKNRVHDFGSGLGVGTKQFTNKIVTSHEPFVPIERIVKFKGTIPKYRSAIETIKNEGLKSKDGIVNLNVLNVIESPVERTKVIKDIGKLLSDDGVAIITTRGADVNTQAKTSKNAVKYLDGWLFGDKEKTFQKGFSQSELEKLIKLVLGKEFKVEKIPSKYKIGTSGVLISRIKQLATGGRVGFSEGDLALSELEGVKNINTVDKQVSTMMEKEKIIVPPEKPLVVSDNQMNKGKEIYNIIKTKLSEKGIENPDNAAAAMTGNIFAENDTFKFDRQEDADVELKGHGLFQFTNVTKDKGHRTEYFNYIKQNNKEDNINSQIDYVLDGIFEGKGYNIGAGNRQKLIESFNKDDVRKITELFMRKYERPANDDSLSKRIKFAKKLFVDKD